MDGACHVITKEWHCKDCGVTSKDGEEKKVVMRNCPSCNYDGGKYGHPNQLNPNNPYKYICGKCGKPFDKK